MEQSKIDELASKGWKVSHPHQKKKVEVSCNSEGIVITTYGPNFVQAESTEQVASNSNTPSNNQEEIIMTTNQTQAQETVANPSSINVKGLSKEVLEQMLKSVQEELAANAPKASEAPATPEAPAEVPEASGYGLKDFGMDVAKFTVGAAAGAAGMFAYDKWFK